MGTSLTVLWTVLVHRCWVRDLPRQVRRGRREIHFLFHDNSLSEEEEGAARQGQRRARQDLGTGLTQDQTVQGMLSRLETLPGTQVKVPYALVRDSSPL